MNTKYLIFVFLFWGTFTTLYAQKGSVFLHHYTTIPFNVENNDVVQGKEGEMYFANTRGIYLYDGVRWDRIKTETSPYVLDKNKEDEIYVGGRENIGYLSVQATGKKQYTPIEREEKEKEKQPQKIGKIQQIAFSEKSVFFMSQKALIQVSMQDKSIQKIWKSSSKHKFEGLLSHQNQVYINIEGKGLHQVKTDYSFQLLPGGKLFASQTITSFFAQSSQKTLITTSQHQVYAFEGSKFQKFNLASQEYITENSLVKGRAISEKTFALATLSGGILLIDNKTGETLETINYQTGLPDDEVRGMVGDNQKGIWICHARGVSRANLEVPVRDFSYYPGLEGKITHSIYFDNTLYVATNEGLFYLTKTQTYQEIATILRGDNYQVMKVIEREEGGKTVVGELINKTFSRRKRRKKEIVVPPKSKTVSLGSFKSEKQKKVYALQSAPYLYKPLKNIRGKITKLRVYQNTVLVGTNLGLFQLLPTRQIIPVLEGEYIHYFSPSGKDKLYVGTQTGLFLLQNSTNFWKVQDRFDKIHTPVYSLVLQGKTLWVGGDSQVMKVSIDGQGAYKKHRVYALDHQYDEKVMVKIIDGKPAFFLSGNAYTPSEKFYPFEKHPGFSGSKQYTKFLISQNNTVWIKRRHRWETVASTRKIDTNQLQWLSLMEDIESIYAAKSIWAVNGHRLYQVQTGSSEALKAHFQVSLQQIEKGEGEFLSLKRPSVYQKIPLRFCLAHAFYTGESQVQYQYKLKGIHKKWSEWTPGSEINFPFLPGRHYTLQVQARNALGQVSDVKNVRFRVIPPFWETWWFYLLEIVVLMALVFTSMIANQFDENSRVAYILTLVTIITVFEFIILLLEPSVESFSAGVPILKLGMNIVLALSLNPLEQRLSEWVKKNRALFHYEKLQPILKKWKLKMESTFKKGG